MTCKCHFYHHVFDIVRLSVVCLPHYLRKRGLIPTATTVTSGLYYKSFMIIIYNRNDIGLYYKTMIGA